MGFLFKGNKDFKDSKDLKDFKDLKVLKPLNGGARIANPRERRGAGAHGLQIRASGGERGRTDYKSARAVGSGDARIANPRERRGAGTHGLQTRASGACHWQM
jgi:hypothetical protein